MAVIQNQKEFKIRKAQTDDIHPLAKMLARAFDDDQVINWLIRQDHRREKSFLEFFKNILLPRSIRFGEVYTTDDLRGVAIWYPPEKWKIPFFKDFL